MKIKEYKKILDEEEKKLKELIELIDVKLLDNQIKELKKQIQQTNEISKQLQNTQRIYLHFLRKIKSIKNELK